MPRKPEKPEKKPEKKPPFGPPAAPSSFALTHPNAAGVDIGSASHFVAVPADRDGKPVREFSSVTAGLEQLADWLTQCGIDTVAMESTGVYWIPLFELLDGRGFTVMLVNARHVKGVPGRKSDVLDCQWLQKLASYGLLAGAFRPRDEICTLRAYVRQRAMLIQSAARCVQHMQKALVQMNVRLDTVISDIVGQTGQRIIRAIVAGERDGRKLAALRDQRVHASVGQIAAALRGTWRPEHLFALRQALELFDTYACQVTACDREIESLLASLGTHSDDPPPSKPGKGRGKNAPSFDARTLLWRTCGVDLTQIDSIDVTTALKIVSEIGTDVSRFPTKKRFTSWLNLCPTTRITGSKRLSGPRRQGSNRAAQALRVAAANLRTSKSALGAWYRRMLIKHPTAKAVNMAAHKLARLIYTLLTKGQQYVDKGTAHEEARHHDRQLRQLRKRAQALGLTLVPTAPTPVS